MTYRDRVGVAPSFTQQQGGCHKIQWTRRRQAWKVTCIDCTFMLSNIKACPTASAQRGTEIKMTHGHECLSTRARVGWLNMPMNMKAPCPRTADGATGVQPERPGQPDVHGSIGWTPHVCNAVKYIFMPLQCMLHRMNYVFPQSVYTVFCPSSTKCISFASQEYWTYFDQNLREEVNTKTRLHFWRNWNRNKGTVYENAAISNKFHSTNDGGYVCRHNF